MMPVGGGEGLVTVVHDEGRQSDILCVILRNYNSTHSCCVCLGLTGTDITSVPCMFLWSFLFYHIDIFQSG
jgi:hypothetical protein